MVRPPPPPVGPLGRTGVDPGNEPPVPDPPPLEYVLGRFGEVTGVGVAGVAAAGVTFGVAPVAPAVASCGAVAGVAT